MNSWGLAKSSGDNPGDWKVLLDLGFWLREGMPRTGERTPTGTGRPSLAKGAFGPLEEENGLGPRGESGSGRDEKPRVPMRRATGRPGAASSGATTLTDRVDGQPEARAAGCSSRATRKHPNCDRVERPEGVINVRHGRPGQRERRQWAANWATRSVSGTGTDVRATDIGAGVGIVAGKPVVTPFGNGRATGTGPQTGIARRTFGYDGRCVGRVEG